MLQYSSYGLLISSQPDFTTISTIMLEFLRPYLSLAYALPALLLFYIIYTIAYKVIQDHQISKLGARAPVRKTYLPYGIDMLYQVLKYMLADKNYELWVLMFEKWGKGGYTVEAGTGERVILTAEPDNIKAILATQFKDYGKGEKFRRDWYPFLGNGIFTTDGALWHNSRQLIRPQFIKDRLSDIDLFEEHVQVLLTRLGEGREVDMLDMFFR